MRQLSKVAACAVKKKKKAKRPLSKVAVAKQYGKLMARRDLDVLAQYVRR